jgi:hypothetical protein
MTEATQELKVPPVQVAGVVRGRAAAEMRGRPSERRRKERGCMAEEVFEYESVMKYLSVQVLSPNIECLGGRVSLFEC